MEASITELRKIDENFIIFDVEVVVPQAEVKKILDKVTKYHKGFEKKKRELQKIENEAKKAVLKELIGILDEEVEEMEK